MKPLVLMPQILPKSAQFGAKRKYDIHTGLDLHCEDKSIVLAIESGIVKKVSPFTGIKANSDWWLETDYVGIESKSGYIVYGEMESFVKENDSVIEGQIIGIIKPVLKKDKGHPRSMLHLELYSQFIEDPIVWELNQPKPKFLLDPIILLKSNKITFK